MPSFGDVVGQGELKEALLAVAANDDLDGLLIRGEKGTAKSTAVRALTNLLPVQDAIADCPYGCPPDAPAVQCVDCRERSDPPTAERSVPLVTLPLGATRERVAGTLSVADALGGDHQFDPGLLARANRGILYVDEVNLLDDHLVDLLLDAAASGVNRVERDGVSVSHPSAFTLVGTMNPEEGDLRPQLRDRFALQATVTACEDVDRRVEIIDRAIGRTDGDGTGLSEPDGGRAETTAPGDRLRRARDGLDEVELPTEFAEEIAELFRDAGVEGHRGDIAAARAARTFAALDGRPKVLESDVRRAAELALPHRLRSRPFEDAPDPEDLVDEQFDGEESDGGAGDERSAGDEESGSDEADGEEPTPDETDDAGDPDDGGGHGDPPDDDGGYGNSCDDGGHGTADRGNDPDSTEPPETADGNDAPERETASAGADGRGSEEDEAASGDDERGRDDSENDDQTAGPPLLPGQERAGVGESESPELSASDAVDEGGAGGGSRSRAEPSVDTDGSRVRTRRADSNRDIDAAASVRAAASRGADSVDSRDLRRSVRRGESSALVLFVVDASASMRPAMRAAKGTVLELLKDAYRQRDEVGFVAFAGDGADVLLPPTESVTLAARHLKDLPTGDRTPLPAGLRTAREVIDRADPAASVVVLVTDGRANVADGSPVGETREAARGLTELGARVVVVDAGDDDRRGLAGLVAEETDGERVPLSGLSAETIDERVGTARGNQV